MRDTIEGHLSDGALEEYSLYKLDESSISALEEHLFVCDFCRARLEAIEPVNFVHYTADGLIFSRVTRLRSGKVMARHWGKELEGGKPFGSVSAGKKYLSESFSHMFPEHECDGRCGPTQEKPEMMPKKVARTDRRVSTSA